MQTKKGSSKGDSSKKGMRKNVGKMLVGLVVIVVLAFVFMRGDQLDHLIKTIEEGSPVFLVLAVVVQMCKYLSQGGGFIWCFKAVGARLRYLEGVKLVFATFFVDTVIPSFNMSGTSIVIEQASRDHIPSGRSVGAALLRQVSINAGFLVIMVAAYIALAFTKGMQSGWLLLGAIAVVIVGGMVAVMVFAALKPNLLYKILMPIMRIADRILAHFKREPIDSWVHDTVNTYSKSAKLMAQNKRDIAVELSFSVLSSICEMCCFSLCCFAFGIHEFEAMVCGYVVVTLCAMVSIVPQGVGIVEAALLVAFTLFGIEQATGMAAVMVYRAIVFWLPFLIGAIVIQRISR